MDSFTVDFTRSVGTIKPVHGVVGGPLNRAYSPFWDLDSRDLTKRFQEIGVPFVRLHDTSWPYSAEVDIHAVFPDFSADPEDPRSYDFVKTDIYLKDIAATGAKIHYRLGETIEHHPVKRRVIAPQDPEKWAKICVGIVKHCNEGWADGLHLDIRDWEIWEEADGGDLRLLWVGSPEQYYDLYEAASLALKAHDPTLRVGGYAGYKIELPFLDGFLSRIRDRKLPLDFFNFDVYADDPAMIARRANYARQKLDEYGFPQVPIRIAEWNCDGFTGENPLPGETTSAFAARRVMGRKGCHAGAFLVGSMLIMQDLPIEAAAYYTFGTATPDYTLFDAWCNPEKAYFAFVAFGNLYRHSRRVQVLPDSTSEHEVLPDVFCCAGLDESGEGDILVSNFCPDAQDLILHIKPQSDNPGTAEIFVVDETHCLERTSASEFQGTTSLRLNLPAYGVVQILMRHGTVS